MTDEIKDKDEDQSTIITPEKINKARRSFLAHTGMYTAGLMGSALLGACSNGDDNVALAQNGGGNDSMGNGPGGQNVDAAIGNFALNLEYLEAEFYYYAATGSGFPGGDGTRSGIGTRGSVESPGGLVAFGNDAFGQLVRNYANEIAVDEYNHVLVLRQALGEGAVAEPQINLTGAFQAAASAAGLGDNFDYTASPTNFLLAAFIFEDVGVTAYNGAAPLVTNPDVLRVAAGNLAAEAYHAGLIRTVLYAQAMQDGNEQLFNTVQAISDARDQLDRDGDQDQGIDPSLDGNPDYAADTPDGSTGDASNIVPLNSTGQAFARTPTQVLDIVYLNTADSGRGNGGGFFPSGVNTNDGDLFRQGTDTGSGGAGSGSDSMDSAGGTGGDSMDNAG